MSSVPEPSGAAGPRAAAPLPEPAAIDYPPLPPGYMVLDELTLRSLTERVAIGQAEIDRLNDVISRLPEEVRIKAEEESAKNRTKKVHTTVTHWACFDAGHRHEGELEAQDCIDTALGAAPATEGS